MNPNIRQWRASTRTADSFAQLALGELRHLIEDANRADLAGQVVDLDPLADWLEDGWYLLSPAPAGLDRAAAEFITPPSLPPARPGLGEQLDRVSWLAEAAHWNRGVLRRLIASLDSIRDRADGNTTWEYRVLRYGDHGAHLEVSVYSTSGFMLASRAWWLSAQIEVEVGEDDLLLRLTPGSGTLYAAGRKAESCDGESGSPTGESTFTGVLLGQFLARQFLAYEGRRGVRMLATDQFLQQEDDTLGLKGFQELIGRAPKPQPIPEAQVPREPTWEEELGIAFQEEKEAQGANDQ